MIASSSIFGAIPNYRLLYWMSGTGGRIFLIAKVFCMENILRRKIAHEGLSPKWNSQRSIPKIMIADRTSVIDIFFLRNLRLNAVEWRPKFSVPTFPSVHTLAASRHPVCYACNLCNILPDPGLSVEWGLGSQFCNLFVNL